MRYLGLDLETFSDVDIGKCGAYKYVESDNFEVLLFAYAFDDEPATVIDLKCGDEIPDVVLDALMDSGVKKWAWNANFERACLAKHFDRYFPPEEWEDVMITAASAGLPLALAQASDALGLSEDKGKLKTGKALIRKFCVPCKPTKTNGQRTRNLPEHYPEDWEDFKKYCGRDVDSENTIRGILTKFVPSEKEHRLWCLDARINERGVPFDRQLAEQAVLLDSEYKEGLVREAIALTGLDNPKSVAQTRAWLEEQEGIEVPSLNKKAVADVVSQLTKETTMRFMDLRKELSKTSIKKYETMLNAGCKDDRIRGTMQFYGARTARWAGRLLQVQNLPQPNLEQLDIARDLVKSGDTDTIRVLYDEGLSEILSCLVRTALTGGPGRCLYGVDFAAIEARVTAWLAQEEWRLKAFRDGADIYCTSASQIYGVPVVKHGENGHLRQHGKVAELGCGFGGGVGALKAFGADKFLTEEQMAEVVAQWRAASPNIVRLWKSLENAAIKAVVRKTAVRSSIGGIIYTYENGCLFATLPSGRKVPYWGAQYGPSLKRPGQKSLSYMGVDQRTRKWTRLELWSGILTENVVQACARDIMAEKLMALDNAGFEVIFHVHDEAVIAEPIGGKSFEDALAIMAEPIPWAAGLPLAADGFQAMFYQK